MNFWYYSRCGNTNEKLSAFSGWMEAKMKMAYTAIKRKMDKNIRGKGGYTIVS